MAAVTTETRTRSSSTYIFQQIANRGKAEGLVPGTEEARDWFRDSASTLKRVEAQRLMKNKANLVNRMTMTDVGRMYSFFYDPKHKDTLPFYDRFPLIFVMEMYSDGFLGMNFHYLPPMYRARLMDALYQIEKQDNVRQSKKLKMSYNLMKTAGKFKYFNPCVKRYLTSHVKSRFLYIPYEQWDIALFLPTERFSKSSKTKVWSESKRQIRGK